LSIERYSKKLIEAHCEKLERMYLAAACNDYYDPGVRVLEGEAEIMIPIKEKFFGAAGAVHPSVCFTAMADSAVLAVNSIVEKTLVASVNFEIHLARPIASGELIARSRFLGMSGSLYLAESVLTDPDDNEIGGGKGAFMDSDISLSSDIGYA
jgi:acyl-coenzyme A thioesterase PaaI-like protein